MLSLEENSGLESRTLVKTGLVPQVDALMLWRIVVRQRPIIILGTLLGLALGIVASTLAPPQYVSTFQVIVDKGGSQLLSKQPDASSDRPLDSGMVDSEVEIVKSDQIARRVAKQLNLADDIEYGGDPAGGFRHGIMVRLGLREATTATHEELEDNATDTVANGIKAKRIGLTYIIEVSYTGRNQDKTYRIASALADAYILGGLSTKYEASKLASQWLQDRLAELRTKTSDAELAVQTYKAENNIIDTSRGLMSESQLSDVNAQLVTARAATAEAKARYDRIRQISQSNLVEGSSSDILHSDVVTRLRAQYLDLSGRVADLQAKYGPTHAAVTNIVSKMDEIKRSISDEVGRLAQGSKSDYEIAAAREQSLQRSLDALVAVSGATNQAQVRLHDLESTAQTYRSLYDSFLQKFQETAQQQSFPVADARIIAPASQPRAASFIRLVIIGMAGLLGGAVVGFVIALIRDLMGNNFRSEGDVNVYAGVECLGVLPIINIGSRSLKASLAKIADKSNVLGLEKAAIIRHSVLAPFSRYSETIRNVKVTADIVRQNNQSIVIGIASSVPKEGKTTFAANLAFLCAQMGHKVLLLDGDFHNPSLTRTLTPDAKIGLVDVLSGTCSLNDAIQKDSVNGLDFCPAIVPERSPNTVSLLTSRTMQALLEKARQDYDYVFIDLPPVVPVVDVKAVSFLVDRFIFIIEWEQTSRDVVREAFSQAPALRSRCLGVILNKAEPSALKRFEAYRGKYYNNYYVKTE